MVTWGGATILDRKARNLERWFSLLTALMGGSRPTAGELADRFGVSVRTIYRDVAALEAMHVPVQRREGRYSVLESYRVRPVCFTADELLVLMAALSFAKRIRSTFVGRSAASAMDKLLAVMPASHQELAADIDETLVFDPLPSHSHPSAPGVTRSLTAAIQGSHPVSLEYQSLAAEAPSPRVVHPYGLAYRGTALYLIGYCELRHEIRTFRANRILSAQVLPTMFVRPADFDLERYLGDIWGIEDGPLMRVRLRFSKPVARLACETTWHPTQTTVEEADGSVILQMETRGRNELARWLTGFGGSVEVLAPAELRDAVARLGREITLLYADKREPDCGRAAGSEQ
ncbi:MAG: helix-turn-helix transcriptional regulator [Chloroflexota bacterium]